MIKIIIDKITKALNIAIGDAKTVNLNPIKYTSDAGINLSTSDNIQIPVVNGTRYIPSCDFKTNYSILGLLLEPLTSEPFAHLEPGTVEYIIDINGYDMGYGLSFPNYVLGNLYTARMLNDNEYIEIDCVRKDSNAFELYVKYNLMYAVDVYIWFKLNNNVFDIYDERLYNVLRFRRTLNNSSYLTENNGAYNAFIRRT